MRGMDTENERFVDVAAPFRHSAGQLGTHFLATIRDEARLLGWRTGRPPRVLVPPKDLGQPGEWVELGDGATLEAYAPTEWLSNVRDASNLEVETLALVRIDGADTATLALLRPAPSRPDEIPVGARLVTRFADLRTGSLTDFWFERGDE
jgi:uncharacterized OB-fold protein